MVDRETGKVFIIFNKIGFLVDWASSLQRILSQSQCPLFNNVRGTSTVKSNYVPPSVNTLLFEHYSEFIIYSFDVSEDDRYAIVALSLEDPDFPELWIYDGTTNTMQKIEDRSVLSDDPMGKAFWDENQHDIASVSHDDEPLYSLMALKPGTFEFLEMREVPEPTPYMKDKNKYVISFLIQSAPHEESNEPSNPAYETDNPYEKCLRLFLDDFRTTIKEEQVICKLSGEGGIKTWDTTDTCLEQFYCH